MADHDESLFSAFLKRSLILLASEAPQHFAAARSHMRGISARISIEGAPAVRVQLDAEPWVGPAAHAEVDAEVSEGDLAALLRGALTIEQAIHEERLLLRGSLDALLAFLDALWAWIHGAVRSPSLAPLYREYLSQIDGGSSNAPSMQPPERRHKGSPYAAS